MTASKDRFRRPLGGTQPNRGPSHWEKRTSFPATVARMAAKSKARQLEELASAKLQGKPEPTAKPQ